MTFSPAGTADIGTVRVAVARLPEVDLGPGQVRLLHPVELHRAERYTRREDRDAFLARRVSLRHFWAGVLRVCPSSLILDFACAGCAGRGAVDHGRPGFSLPTGASFGTLSMSRSGPWCVFAGSRDPDVMSLGIDLEDSRRVGFDGFDAVALGMREKTLVQQLPDEARRDMLRARLWARKEAVLKSARTGLTHDPSALEVHGSTSGGNELIDLDVRELGLPPVFVLGLAVARVSTPQAARPHVLSRD